jgi:hypothetical protein
MSIPVFFGDYTSANVNLYEYPHLLYGPNFIC